MKIKALLPIAALLGAASAQAATTVFSTNFDSGLSAAIAPGSASLTGVQGYAGLGPAGNQFGSSFLRSMTGNTVTLALNNLPAHDSLSIAFLFAAIDSLDGTGTYPSGDYFHITLDGQQIFRESFANAMLSQIQSYVPPAGVELARHADLGFSGPGGYYTDSAYNLGADPQFSSIAHTASTAVFTFTIEGVGIQSLNDESWAMDNLQVSVNAVPEPEAYAMMLAGLGLVGWAARRSKQA
ncbi:MAG: PEP-CTERM sorting domain-containing protein [Hydrogenophilales bacterium RIFOXYA1_FULL_63_33]|nr:MAG: PEP-CTERM sorting domain-containing protein [Hydrogenophilales bacterium RIFOXYA1_FULL_63_33]